MYYEAIVRFTKFGCILEFTVKFDHTLDLDDLVQHLAVNLDMTFDGYTFKG